MHTLTFDEIEALSRKYSIYMDDWADDYGEPGYSLSPDSHGVLFGDWNKCPSHVAHVLEKQFDLEWLDEWITGRDSAKAYRTNPDSYGWLPYYAILNGEIVGGDEIEDDPWEYVEEYLLNNADHACTFKIDLTAFGFTRIGDDRQNTYETGFHPGQNDDPHKIMADMQAKYPGLDFVFGDLATSQFDAAYSLYVRDSDWETN